VQIHEAYLLVKFNPRSFRHRVRACSGTRAIGEPSATAEGLLVKNGLTLLKVGEITLQLEASSPFHPLPAKK